MDEKSLSSKLFHVDGKKPTAIKPIKASKTQPVVPFEQVFENLPEAIIITDRQGRLLHANLAATALLGDSHEALELKDWPRTFGLSLGGKPPLPLSSDEICVTRALQGETVEAQEILVSRDGDKEGTWISMSAIPIRSGNGSIEGALVNVRDIHARKRIEDSREIYIRRMETLYRLSHIMAESGNDLKRLTHSVTVLASEAIGDLCVISLLAGGGHRLEVPAFYDTSSTSRNLFRKVLSAAGELNSQDGLAAKVVHSGKPILIDAVPPEQLQAVVLPEFRKFVEQVGVESILVVPLIGRSGVLGTITLSRHRSNQAYTSGDQSFLMEIAYRTALAIENSLLVESLRSEIAERLSAEQALGVSEERFRSIFESTTLGIKILDLGGNILHTNSSYQEMIGYTASELVGRHFYDFLHPEDVSRALRLFHDLKISGVPDFRFDHRARHKNGDTVWVRTTFTGVKKGGGDESLVFIVGIVENVSAQKRIEMEMGELKSRLQNGMEMERLRLAQELHDGPMQELYNTIYRIEELRMKVAPELGSALEKTNHDIQKVLQDLRAAAKELRPPTISSFGLEKAIRSHVDDFQEKHPEIHIELALDQDRQLLPENVRLALFRVLQQALVNIGRHSQATEARVRFAFDAEQAILEIRDNGRGFRVPANWIELVRHEHYGLAGSAERMSALNGTFTVESTPGESTTVRAVVPWQEPTTSLVPLPEEES
jgi:PAS domain S-box-containing protein